MQRILSPLGIEVKTAAMLGLELPDVVEDGDTFEANAAAFCARLTEALARDLAQDE